MDKYIIAVISDTHDLLREGVLEKLNGCEAILHGGDISSPEILETLRKIAPVYAVRGNADETWGADLPSVLDTELYGLKICIAHKKKDLPADLARFDLVITGHTHKYEEKRKGHTLFLNPGSCGPRKPGQPVTMAILHISGRDIISERIDLPNKPQKRTSNAVDPGDMKKLITTVIKQVKKKKSVDEIAELNGISGDLAERIVRLYLTHPGVTADGIMEKMGL